MPSPRPKPTILKTIAGNPGKRPLNEDAPVKLELPKCPGWMHPEGKRYWKQLGAKLVQYGLIGDTDQAAYFAHCDAVGRLQQICREFDTMEKMTAVKMDLRDRLWRQVISSAVEFGLTPSARSKVKVPKLKDQPFKDWSQFG
jgi:P27 family predicted phage terminase small subunit